MALPPNRQVSTSRLPNSSGNRSSLIRQRRAVLQLSCYMWIERSENLEEAGQFIRRALEMEPNNGAYIDSLGWLYF